MVDLSVQRYTEYLDCACLVQTRTIDWNITLCRMLRNKINPQSICFDRKSNTYTLTSNHPFLLHLLFYLGIRGSCFTSLANHKAGPCFVGIWCKMLCLSISAIEKNLCSRLSFNFFFYLNKNNFLFLLLFRMSTMKPQLFEVPVTNVKSVRTLLGPHPSTSWVRI